ncbi:hypothetical protein GCM10010339_68670 [Streptomyces alanosinicus]|uniref:Uncharacterized protein n=1 Tax=Streptomyces alanosinicus TaxID=68171 RepID=A0A919D5X1_9ACTN|nr:hypothetical protein GCM10010339_68670 [Streptomyces alanosinicus]
MIPRVRRQEQQGLLIRGNAPVSMFHGQACGGFAVRPGGGEEGFQQAERNGELLACQGQGRSVRDMCLPQCFGSVRDTLCAAVRRRDDLSADCLRCDQGGMYVVIDARFRAP